MLALRTLRHGLIPSFRTYSSLHTLSETQLNNELLSLSTAGQYSAAERLRFKIISNGLNVHPRVEYASIALACLRNRRLTGTSGLKLDEYLAWLDLIPDREYLTRSLPSSNLHPKTTSPFDSIVYELTYRTPIPKFHPFVGNTGLVIASKGYVKHHFLTLARPLLLNSPHVSSPSVSSLLQMEHNAARYESSYALPSSPIASYIRSSLIQLFIQRGWVLKGVELLLMKRDYPMEDHVYQVVVEGLSRLGVEETKKRGLVLKRWERDKSAHLTRPGKLETLS